MATRISIEEPHHGIQFGASGTTEQLSVLRRRPDGKQSPPSRDARRLRRDPDPEFPLAFRDESLRVVEIAALRKLLSYEADLRDPPRNIDDPEQIQGMPLQNGSSAFAIELLQLPWRQVYDDDAEDASGPHSVAIRAGALADALDVGALTAALRGER